MVKRCAWGLCKSDSRYEERLAGGVFFVPFPKLGRSREKARRWIRLCGRPSWQLNEDMLRERRKAKHLFVCSKHFPGGKPSTEHPDPLPALQHDHPSNVRRRPRVRQATSTWPTPCYKETAAIQEKTTVIRVPLAEISDPPVSASQSQNKNGGVLPEVKPNSQAEFSALDFLALAAENKDLEERLAKAVVQNENLKRCCLKPQTTSKSTATSDLDSSNSVPLTVKSLSNHLFQYYTGFNSQRFWDLYKFLVPNEQTPLNYSKKTLATSLSLQDQVLLVLVKLRQNFDFKHMAILFRISSQDCSTIFTNWINYMFHRLGSLVIWPHRDVIISNMPENFKKDYPNTVVIIDGTELKIERPSSLNRQSQCYSSYKSCTTLKGLVGVDPRGSIIFASMLYAGSISDKELHVTAKSGFLDTLKLMLQNGKLLSGDAVMADKGFTIEEEIHSLSLSLNIPPFVSASASQMTASQVAETIKIAKHRVHVERAISRIKQFKILAGKISLSLFGIIDQMWLVCCMLTNFMPFLLQK